MIEQRWIRRKACSVPEFDTKLREVDALCIDIFDARMPQRFRFYQRFQVFLSDDHAKAVEHTLSDLVHGGSEGEDLEERADAFNPTAKECMFLDAACRLRTIGLLWGLFPDERTQPNSPPGDGNDAAGEPMLFDVSQPQQAPWETESGIDSLKVHELIETFPERSARFIAQFWQYKCSWQEAERLTLAEILTGYLPSVPLDAVPETVGDVRVRKLAALLRLAASCTIGPNVCPLEIRLQMKPDMICDPRKTHLAPVDWIFETIFDRGQNLFEVRGNVPPRQDVPDPRPNGSSLPVASIDYDSGLQFLGMVIQDVVSTVSPYLEMHPNTAIRTVKVTTHRLRTRVADPEQYLPQHWLLPLASAINGAEVAGMTAVVLRSFCRYGFKEENVSFRDQVEQACYTAEEMHPFNALVRKLVRYVRTAFDWREEPSGAEKEALASFLDYFLIERATQGDATADKAIESGVLQDDDGQQVDIAIISDFGRCVLSTLIRAHFRGEVWLVEPVKESRGQWVPDPSDRIEEILAGYQIKVRRVAMGALRTMLVGLGTTKSCVYLTGSKGYWHDGDKSQRRFICSQGVWTVAKTVSETGGRAAVLSERDKRFELADDILHVQGQLAKLFANFDSRPWVQVEVVDQDDFWKAVVNQASTSDRLV